MNFATATTSEKLNWLADLIEGKFANIFEQMDANLCVVGLGTRIDENGELSERNGVSLGDFSQRYGISADETFYLFVSHYENLNIGMPSHQSYDITPQIAAQALRLLAEKYER